VYIDDKNLPLNNTQCGRSRAQHVRDRDADIENAKNWRLVHLQRSKGEARMAEPTFGMCFRARAAKEANGEGRADALAILVLWRKENRAARAEPASPFLVASDQKLQILALVVSP